MRYSGLVFYSERFFTAEPIRKQLFNVLLFTLFVCPLAAAQTVTLGGGASSAGLETDIRLGGIEAEGLTFGVRAASDLEAETFEFGASTRFSTSLGPLGRVSVTGSAAADTAGAFAASVRGSGVLGPVGARARLDAFNVNPGRFEPEDLFAGERPFLLAAPSEEAFAAQVGLGVTYRLSRTKILTFDPDLLYLRGDGLGVRGAGTLELRRLRGRDNGIVLAEGYLSPGADEGYGALGFTYALNQRTLPTLRGSLLVGAGSEGLAPGARLFVQKRGRLDYSLTLAAEPYRVDAPRVRAETSLAGALGSGTLRTTLLTAPTEDFSVPLFTLRSAYQFSF